MAWVTEQFLNAWRSRLHIGGNKPRAVVQVASTRYVRSYHEWTGPRVRAKIPGETGENPWWPKLVRYTDWMTLPNVKSVEVQQDFDGNGLQIATVVMDNVAYVQQTGAMSQLYHLIQPGYYSPIRGFASPVRPEVVAGNEWSRILRQMIAVRVWEGFGEPVLDEDGEIVSDGGPNGAWVFHGLADKPDLDSVPATITLVARMGKTLTEQRIFGWNKSRSLRDPVTFADRRKADEIISEGYNVRASSTQDAGDYSTANAVDSDSDDYPTYWASNFHGGPNVTEWLQLSLPEGRYSSFRLDAAENMDLYVGVRPKAQKDGDPPTVNGDEVAVDEWIDTVGTVPGANGGWGYMHTTTSIEGSNVYSLGGEIVVGKGTRLRIGFRNLAVMNSTPEYAAFVRYIEALRRHRLEEAKKQKWVLIEDVSDMVRVALRWAGYGEWEIEDTGIRLPEKQTFNRSQYLIDIIKWAQELTGFVFFMADPDTRGSRGIPTFRRNATLLREPGAVAAELTERDLLTGLQGSLNEEPLAFNIRVRGKEAAKRKGGRTLGGDRIRRIMYEYTPPWSEVADPTGPAPLHQLGGVLKHVTHTYNHARSLNECKMAVFLIAIAEALEYAKAVAELPANVNIELDDQVGLLDTATGVNSRLWVASRTHTLTQGVRDAGWKMTVGGTLIDNELLVLLLTELAEEEFGDLPHPLAVHGGRQRRIRA